MIEIVIASTVSGIVCYIVGYCDGKTSNGKLQIKIGEKIILKL